MNGNESLKIRGDLQILIDQPDKPRDIIEVPNTILIGGKSAVAKSLGYDIGGSFQFYVDRMLFGDGGEESGVPRDVSASRTSLFGETRANISVVASSSPDFENQVIFTAVLTTSHANGYDLNEAALQMANGSLFSLVTFGGISKTSLMTLTFNWTLTVV